MYPHITDRLVNTPLLITEDKLNIITSQVTIHLLSNNLAALDMSEKSNITKEYESSEEYAIIPIRNSLVAKNGGGSSGSTSYEFIRESAKSIIDSGINTIIFDVTSGGGEAAGCFPLCDFIYNLQSQGIRTIGFTDTYACSGGYAILSSCSEVYATDMAIVGSIGAVMSIVDVTKMDAAMGIKYDILRSKELKGGYSPHEKITEPFRQDLLDGLKLVDTKFDLATLKYRKGKLTQQTITELKGKSIVAQEGLTLGLVDRVVSGIDEVLGLISSISSNSVNSTLDKGVNMTGNTPSIESQYIASQTELSQLKESLNTKIAAAVSDERARCAAILKAGQTYSIDSDMVQKAIERGYSMDTVEDSFSYVKEKVDTMTSVKTTGNSTKTEAIPEPQVTGEAPKTYMEQLMADFTDTTDQGGK
jgi:ClpP class serine protease